MEFRLWIGLWTGFFLLLIVAFNFSFLVKFITRFTEDCFATLVAIIFVIDAIKSTLKLRLFRSPVLDKDISNLTTILSSNNFTTLEPFENQSNSYLPQYDDLDLQLQVANQTAVFYFSVLLFLMTFVICMGLKSFREKPFLPSKVKLFFYFFFFVEKKINILKVRQIFSDFAVMIAIIIASAIDFWIGLSTQKLLIPHEFKVTV